MSSPFYEGYPYAEGDILGRSTARGLEATHAGNVVGFMMGEKRCSVYLLNLYSDLGLQMLLTSGRTLWNSNGWRRAEGHSKRSWPLVKANREHV